MAVKALYPYDFPSADRAELFGPDQLVYVMWEGNLFLCSAAAFRAPKTMPFKAFFAEMVVPWAMSDPDFDAAAVAGWRLFDTPLDVSDGTRSLAQLGIGHKGLLRFRTA